MAENSVLVVDDEPPVLRLLAWVMSGEGWDVHTVPDAETALKQLPGLRPDVVLVDVRLPGMSGVELSERIKEMSGTRVVLMSAYDRPRTHSGDAFVAKPFDINELARLLSGVLESRQG
jgi:CheY-like chemotaxis protein